VSLRNLSLETLKDLDCGQAAEAFNAALKRAIQDCVSRPSEDRVRKVVLQCELNPTDTGDDIEVLFQIKDTLPTFQTQSCRMSVRKQAGQLQLVFQSDEDDDKAA